MANHKDSKAVDRARGYFLTDDNIYGCAETTLIVLQEHYGLPHATESSAAMALNGGIAWSGSVCGAISGAALATGRLAGQRITDHKEAKRVSRTIIAQLMDDFRAEYGSLDCRDLIGLDISSQEGHDRFLESKMWHGACMSQIEFVLHRLVSLGDEQVWKETLERMAMAG